MLDQARDKLFFYHQTRLLCRFAISPVHFRILRHDTELFTLLQASGRADTQSLSSPNGIGVHWWMLLAKRN